MTEIEKQYRHELEKLDMLETAWGGITKMFEKLYDENETATGESDSNGV